MYIFSNISSENACALPSREKYYFFKTKHYLYCSTDIIKHLGTNFVILNIFWKQKISEDSVASLCEEFCIGFHVALNSI